MALEVEIDESKFGKRKYYRGHRVEGQWIFVGREKYNKKKVFMIPVHNRKQKHPNSCNPKMDSARVYNTQ